MPNPYVNKVQKSDGTTIIDISDTTAVASDVAEGKYFYLATGQKVIGTATGGGGGYVTQDANGFIILPATGDGGGGGSSVQTATGTFTGSGTTQAQISCNFAPDLIYVYGDLSGDISLRGVVSVFMVKDEVMYVTCDGSTSNADEYAYSVNHHITEYNQSNQSGQPYATYSNGVLTFDTNFNSTSAKFNSSITYSYKLMKWS